MTYKIRVKSLDGQILTYTGVTSYSIENGLLIFKDNKDKIRIFAAVNCQIEGE